LSSLIKLENVSKSYHLGDQSFAALKSIDLEIFANEFTAIVGASGSGKSTLMHILGFLDTLSSGKYFFGGLDVSSLSENALAEIRNTKIGFVFQSFFLLPRYDALQNVMLPLFYRGIREELAKDAAMQMLDKVGMMPFVKHRPNQLSGGQQQRVAIARSLVGNPDIVLADEPTGALDSKTGKEVMDLLKRLHREEGRTIIIITHDQEISKQCLRVITIKDGKIASNET